MVTRSITSPLDLVLNPPIHIPYVTIFRSIQECMLEKGWLIVFSCSMKDEDIQVIPFTKNERSSIRIQEDKGMILETSTLHTVHKVTLDENGKCKHQELNLPLFVLESLHGLREEEWVSMISVMTRDARLQYLDAKDILMNDKNEFKRYRREIQKKNNVEVSNEYSRDKILYERTRENVCLMFIQALDAMEAKISFIKQQ
jgi:hypothetical protein